MINPFEEIVGNGLSEGEEIEGAMDCQTCMVTVHRGLYFDEEKLLVWVCPEGHRSKIEGFHLD